MQWQGEHFFTSHGHFMFIVTNADEISTFNIDDIWVLEFKLLLHWLRKSFKSSIRCAVIISSDISSHFQKKVSQHKPFRIAFIIQWLNDADVRVPIWTVRVRDCPESINRLTADTIGCSDCGGVLKKLLTY